MTARIRYIWFSPNAKISISKEESQVKLPRDLNTLINLHEVHISMFTLHSIHCKMDKEMCSQEFSVLFSHIVLLLQQYTNMPRIIQSTTNVQHLNVWIYESYPILKCSKLPYDFSTTEFPML